MIEVEVDNRSGVAVDEAGAVELARKVLSGEGVESGELGLVFVGPEESRALKLEHLDIDEATDALAFPLDALDDLPDGLPRQLGDVVMCPQVVGDDWQAPLVHAVLHLVGYDHGSEMEAREALHSMSLLTTRRDPEERRSSSPPAIGRAPSLLDSFNYAFEGIIHVLRTQRNLRIHFIVAIGVIAAAAALGVGRLELIVLLLAIAFVLVSEMVNSAIEGAIDVSTTSFDPNAKLAKDIAAGAVLISSATAVAIGYLVFAHAAAHRSARLLDRIRDAPAEITLAALVLVMLVVIATKAWTGRGTPLRGGLPSGHAALAFAGWMAATYVIGDDHRFFISSLTFLMALLVAQTRVEAGVHSGLEVLYGGALGALITLVVFQVLS